MTAIATQAANLFTADIELSIVNGSVDSHPDKAILVLDEDLLMQIATAQAGLLAMGFGYSELTIPLNVDLKLFEDGDEWIEEERDPADGDFDISSTWLMIQANCISIEIWDEHGDAELHGAFNINSVPGLEAALARLATACTEQLISRLK